MNGVCCLSAWMLPNASRERARDISLMRCSNEYWFSGTCVVDSIRSGNETRFFLFPFSCSHSVHSRPTDSRKKGLFSLWIFLFKQKSGDSTIDVLLYSQQTALHSIGEYLKKCASNFEISHRDVIAMISNGNTTNRKHSKIFDWWNALLNWCSATCFAVGLCTD